MHIKAITQPARAQDEELVGTITEILCNLTGACGGDKCKGEDSTQIGDICIRL